MYAVYHGRLKRNAVCDRELTRKRMQKEEWLVMRRLGVEGAAERLKWHVS